MNRQQIEMLKEIYPEGTRIKLLSMDDTQAPPSGIYGTVRSVDDMGTIHVNWGNGSSLGLIIGRDRFKRV